MKSRLYKFIYVCSNYFVGSKTYRFKTDEEAIEESKVWNHIYVLLLVAITISSPFL